MAKSNCFKKQRKANKIRKTEANKTKGEKTEAERFEPLRAGNPTRSEPLGHNSSSVNFTIKNTKTKASVKKKKKSTNSREALE